VPERAPAVSAPAAGPGSAGGSTVPRRNRRTALVLVAWIALLMLVSALVAWLRN